MNAARARATTRGSLIKNGAVPMSTTTELTSTSSPHVFDFNGLGVRIFDRDNNPWLVLSDVCRVVGIKNPAQAATRLDDDEKVTLILNEGHSGQLGGAQSVTIINESGLYRLLLRSSKPKAKAFQKWVVGEVLPAIRRTGGYGQMSVDALVNDPATMLQLIQGYAQENVLLLASNAVLTSDNTALVEQAGVLGAKVENLAPKAAALDLIAAKTGEENLSDCAKTLGQRPGRMFDWWAVNGWLFKRRDGGPWRANQAKIEAGLLVQRERPDRTRPDRSHVQVMVTPKGRAKLAELLTQGDMLAAPAPARSAA
jgi:prophage antirepressor-like protein